MLDAQRVAASRAAWGWLWPITINQSPKMLAFFSLIFPLTFTVFSAIFYTAKEYRTQGRNFYTIENLKTVSDFINCTDKYTL